MAQVTLISGPERRRRWSSADRARILSAIEAPGAVVAEVARREDICTSLVYKWRLAARKRSKRTEFTPVIVEAGPATSPAPPSVGAGEPGVITVDLDGARIRICADAPATLIAATLKALRS
jgi:transposase